MCLEDMSVRLCCTGGSRVCCGEAAAERTEWDVVGLRVKGSDGRPIAGYQVKSEVMMWVRVGVSVVVFGCQRGSKSCLVCSFGTFETFPSFTLTHPPHP